MSDARTIANAVAEELVGAGADAVVLGGDAGADGPAGACIDLVALGDGPGRSLRVVDGRLVAVSWMQGDDVRALLDSPPDAGGAVPAWRTAEIVVDARARATLLQRFAVDWTWARIDDACDAWVADSLVEHADDVLRLAELLLSDQVVAAAIRSVLALRLPHVVAVHHRVLYGHDEQLWSSVADRMGAEWSADHRAALGIDADPLRAGRAALGLWIRAVDECRSVLTPGDLEVADAAVTVARAAAG